VQLQRFAKRRAETPSELDRSRSFRISIEASTDAPSNGVALPAGGAGGQVDVAHELDPLHCITQPLDRCTLMVCTTTPKKC
jgi:hypothetical protein